MAAFFHPVKMKKILFGYWLTIPLLFGLYSLILAAVKNVPILTIFMNIPSLALTSIVVLLLIFQLFGLYILGRSSDCRHSLLGFYLKFNLIQQLFTVNVPGFLLCLFFYLSLIDAKEQTDVSKQEKWLIYGLIGFISLITILVTWVRLSL
ncbi:hypothetical protein [Enterococcus sp. AZ126]|uniref:hypothetical protein n=1 Tax=Enterococcus sp. AZ126 TaxID=2774635 RepID=UPI003F216967